MKDKHGKVIYVGKAKSIRKRVSQYFQKTDLGQKTEELVKNISNIDFVATDTQVEALLLENTLIKKHKPKYNIDLKSDHNAVNRWFSVWYRWRKVTRTETIESGLSIFENPYGVVSYEISNGDA